MEIEKLVKIGGNEWKSNDGTKHRVYFNKLYTLVPKLKVEFYKTGNVSSATYDGEKISNGQAKNWLLELEMGKLYYDVKGQGWVAQGLPRFSAEIIAGLETKYNSL